MTLDPATQILTDIAIILLLGLIFSLLSKKLRVANILLLIIAGIFIGQMTGKTFHFSSVFLVAIAVLTLVMVVFDGSSRFDLRKVSKFSFPALKLSLTFLGLNLVFLTFATSFLFFPSFTIESILFSLIFAFIMSGTDPSSVFIMLKSKANKVIDFLEIEAIINTPIMVIFPFLILDTLNNLHTANVTTAIVSQFIPLLKQIVVGVGAGMVIGIIVFKTMKKVYSQQFSPVGLITAALLAYILAENLEGNGVLAVATMGLFFGNSYVKGKTTMQEFNNTLSNSLIILVFILIGFIVKIDFQLAVMLKALALFAILLFTRFSSIFLTLNNEFNYKEKLFMTVSMPKGIAAAVVAFSLSVFAIAENLVPMMNTILQLIIIMMIYSLISSSIIDRFSYKLIRVKIEESK